MSYPKTPPAAPNLASPAARAHARMMHVDSMKRFAELASRLDQMAGHQSSPKAFSHEIQSHIKRPAPESISNPTDSAGGVHADLGKQLDQRFHDVMTRLEDAHDEGKTHREVVDLLTAELAKDGMHMPAHTGDVLPADPNMFNFYAGEKPKPGVDLMVVDRPTITGRPPGDTQDMIIVKGKAHVASPSEAQPGKALKAAMDFHSNCTVDFCLNPVHPGPCKGWKSAIKQVTTPHIHAPHAPTLTSPKIKKVASVKSVPKVPVPKAVPPSMLPGLKAPVTPDVSANILGVLQAHVGDPAGAKQYLTDLKLTKTQAQELADQLGAKAPASYTIPKIFDRIIDVHLKGQYVQVKYNHGYGGGPGKTPHKLTDYMPPPIPGDLVSQDYVAHVLGVLLMSGSDWRAKQILSQMEQNSWNNKDGLNEAQIRQMAIMLGIDPTQGYGYYGNEYGKITGLIVKELKTGKYGPFTHELAGFNANPKVIQNRIKTLLPQLKTKVGQLSKESAKDIKEALKQAKIKAKEAAVQAKAAAKQAAIKAKIAAKTPPPVHPVALVYKQPTPTLEKLYQAWRDRRKKAKAKADAMGQSPASITSSHGKKILTHDEILDLSGYAGSGYTTINSYLRVQMGDPHAPVDGESPLLENIYGSGDFKDAPSVIQKNADKVREIDSALAKSALKTDVQLWRGMHYPHLLFGKDWQKKDLTGASWTEHGYSSTSADPSTAQSFGSGVVMRLLGKKGMPAVQLHDWGSEAEYMLSRGLQYKVIAHHPPGKPGSHLTLDGQAINTNVHVLDIELVVKPPTAPAKESAFSRFTKTVQSGIKKTDVLPGGKMGETRLAETNDGDKLVVKTGPGGLGLPVSQVDAEVLTSAVGRAIGAQVPLAMQRGNQYGGSTDPLTVYMEHIDGQHVTTIPTGDDATKLGLLDVLVINGDRTPGNYLVDAQGKVWGIDHGRAFDMTVQADYDPKGDGPPRLKFADFARIFIENPESKDKKDRKWKDNPLSKRDVEYIDEVLAQTHTDFASYHTISVDTHDDWHKQMMTRWAQIKKRAKGDRDIVAPKGWKNKIQRRKEAHKKAEAALKKAAAAAPTFEEIAKKKKAGIDPAKLIAGGDFSDMKKIGPQGGSNPGGLYEAPDGTKWYVKQQKSDEHARNEALAAALYQAAGIDVPQVVQGSGAPGLSGSQTATRWLDHSEKDLQARLASDPVYMHTVKLGFAVDAWLANRDTAGLNYDNIVSLYGSPVRIDVGGALKYRAQGQPKGNFGDSVIEWTGLRDPSINPQNAAIFAGITPDELEQSVQVLESVSDATIRDLVTQHGFPSSFADTMIARRKDIQKRWAEEKAKQLVGVGA